MTKGLYVIRDNVAKAIIGGVHVHAHDAPAIRMFSDIASAENNQVNMHLADHDLLLIGFMDDETGTCTPLPQETPHEVLLGATLKATWDARANSPSTEQ